jgi:hypothetical protein
LPARINRASKEFNSEVRNWFLFLQRWIHGIFKGVTLRDTTPDAAAAQLAVYRRLGPEMRFRLAVEMSEAIRQLARDGIKHRHPYYTESQVTAVLIRQLYGLKGLQP